MVGAESSVGGCRSEQALKRRNALTVSTLFWFCLSVIQVVLNRAKCKHDQGAVLHKLRGIGSRHQRIHHAEVHPSGLPPHIARCRRKPGLREFLAFPAQRTDYQRIPTTTTRCLTVFITMQELIECTPAGCLWKLPTIDTDAHTISNHGAPSGPRMMSRRFSSVTYTSMIPCLRTAGTTVLRLSYTHARSAVG